MNLRDRTLNWRNVSATRIIASTLGVLVGLAGVEHGFFEILQGNISPSSIWIDAIGPSQRFWEYATETALTIVPNFFITGMLAMFVGLLVTIWAAAFVQRKYGARILFLLSIILWLVGGGFAPIFFTIFATVTATRINKPLTWWHVHLPVNVRDFLAKLWPWAPVALVVIFWIGVEIQIFGYPLLWFLNANMTYGIQWALGFIMLGLMLISVLSALTFDIQKQLDSQHASINLDYYDSSVFN
ncbi:MAG: hypothetical protein ACW991_06635 [Candidatus Hodarchaeales archaeon]|jgi:hypothetical protein